MTLPLRRRACTATTADATAASTASAMINQTHQSMESTSGVADHGTPRCGGAAVRVFVVDLMADG
ncbi:MULTISPECIES: hypothetical protein [Streptomyces]|uniref:hypothetical protein n=1 Tax=Streptomyces TaxID=1883 RepID=UPI00035C0C28|nr:MULTISPECIES: hypothetical protein [Streptomyces]